MTVSVAANATYWVVVNDGVSKPATLGRTQSDFETGVTGWSIGNGALYKETATDDWTSSGFTMIMAVNGTIIVPVTVTIEAEHDSIGGGLEDLDFTLTRTGATTDSRDATVTITQDETWLGDSDLSHDVTFAADSATATLTIGWSKFSYAPTSTGTLTATVSGTGITGGSGSVEVISISEPPITFSYDKASYTFAEDATNDSVYVVATLNAAYPRLPSIRTITASFSTRGGTADSAPGGTGDFKAISWMPGLSQSEYARAADTDPWVARYAVPDFDILDDEVYDEGSETFTMIIEGSPGSDFDQVQFAYPDGTTCSPCSPTPAYTVTITDNDNIPPVLSLSADPASIDDEDDASTMDVLENVSIITVETTNDTTFARDTTLTLTFGGTATQGTHYSVLPEDAGLVATGYQVVMPHDADSVEVTVTALRNTSADGDRTVTVAGAIAGTSIAGSGTITIRNVETPLPGAPTGLTATADGTGTIDLAWTAPSEDGGSPITGYRIEVSSDGGGSWTDLEDDTGDTGTTYEHTGLSAGTTRHYRVSAINANGTGSPSGTAGATTDPAAAALVSNTGQADQGQMSPGLSPGNFKWSHAIGFVTGDHAGGYTLSSVQAPVGLDDAASSVQVSIYEANTSGEPDGSLYVLTTPSSISTTVTLVTFTAPADATLAKETTYFVVFEGPTGQAEVTATAANAEDAGKASGWSINNLPYSRNNDATAWSENTSSGTRLKPQIAVNGTTNATAPGAPTDLTATADGSTEIDLAWNAPSSDGGSAITGYKIEVSSDGGTSWTDLVANTGGIGTTYEHAGLTAGTTRHYRVSAINAKGTSTPSGTASATTPATTVPGAPTNLTATADGATAIDLAWTAPSDNGGSPITGYKIEVSSDGSTWTDLVASNTGTTYSHTGLSAGTTRHYRVSAINANGTGNASSTASATTDAVPGAPTLVSNIGLTARSNGHPVGANNPSVKSTQAQEFTAGDNEGGYTLVEVVVKVHSGVDAIDVPRVSIYTESGGEPTASLYTLTNPASFAIGNMTFTAPADATLAKETKYFVVVEETVSTWNVSGTNQNHEETAESGWSIGDNLVWRSQDAGDWTQHNNAALLITVNGTTNTATTTVPGAPTSLTATADGSTEIDLAWTAPSDNGGAAITGYKIEVSPDGTTWTDLVANNTGTTYEHTGLTAGTTRHYRVSAINANGTGTASNVDNATTDAATTPAPVIVTDGVQVTSTPAAGDTYRLNETIEITVTFDNAVTVNTSGGTPRIQFRLDGALNRWAEYSSGSGGTALSFTYTVQSGDKDDNGIWLEENFLQLQGGTISAAADNTVDATLTYDEPGLQSEHKVNGSTVPGAPRNLTATAGGASFIGLAWLAPADNGGSAITGYKIEVSPNGTTWTDLVANTGGTGTTYSHSGLSDGTTRHYRVSAINANGTGPASGTASATTTAATTVPGAPTGLSATASGTARINLSWTVPSDNGGSPITGYKIEVSSDGGSNWTDRVANTNSTGTTYAHTGLSAGTTRHYRVSAINANGTGPASGTASATTNATTTAPRAPTNLKATADGVSTINLAWSAPTDDGGSPITGYRIEVSQSSVSGWTDLVGNTNSTRTSYSHTGLPSRAQRFYRVSAINAIGTGNASGTASARTGDARKVRNVQVDVVVDPNVPPEVQKALGPNKIMALRVDWDLPDIPIGQVRGWLVQWGKVRNCNQSPPNTWDGPNLWFPDEAPPMYYRPAGSAPARYFRVAVAITGGMENGPWSAPVCGDISAASAAAASAAADRADAADGDDALEEALTKIVEGLTPDEAAGALFGEVRLSEARQAALDLLGNGNGRYDLGDLLAWIDRCKRGEARCGTTSADSPPPTAAGFAAAAAAGRPRRRTGRRSSGRKGPMTLRAARRRRGRFAGYALAALLIAATTLSCADGPMGPAAYVQDPGFLTVEWSGPEAGRGTGVLLELDGPTIQAVRAPGLELYESSAPGPHRIVVAGSLRAGPLVQFRVPDRTQSALYRVRVIEVTGDDYQLRDPAEYRAVVITN